MLIVVLVAFVGLLSMPVFGQTDSVEIPTWVKGVANFWVEYKIDDGEFAKALEFLIDSNIIQLGNTQVMSESQIDWEDKYNTSEANRVSQSQSDAAQHKILYDEKDAQYEKLKLYFDGMEAEWKQTYNGMAVEIDDLKKELKILKKN